MKTNTTVDFEIKFFEGIARKRPHYVDALVPLAEAYTRKGFCDKGLEVDQKLALLCKDDSVVHYNLACSLALVGKLDDSISALSKAIELGYDDFKYLLSDQDLKPLHSHPNFKKILNKKKLG